MAAVRDWLDSTATNLFSLTARRIKRRTSIRLRLIGSTALRRTCGAAMQSRSITGIWAPNVQDRAQHRNLRSPFEQIGHADITAGVDWTSIVDRAQSNGMRVAGFTDQHHFVTGIISTSLDLSSEGGAKTKRELQTLLHPEMLGRAFQVLGLAKNVDLSGPPLAGLRFAGRSDSALTVPDRGQ